MKEDFNTDLQDKNYAFFCNKKCEFFPCHNGIDLEKFNCLFCFCPLYVFGNECGGNFKILENGVKDCSSCSFPHDKDNYEKIIKKLTQR